LARPKIDQHSILRQVQQHGIINSRANIIGLRQERLEPLLKRSQHIYLTVRPARTLPLNRGPLSRLVITQIGLLVTEDRLYLIIWKRVPGGKVARQEFAHAAWQHQAAIKHPTLGDILQEYRLVRKGIGEIAVKVIQAIQVIIQKTGRA